MSKTQSIRPTNDFFMQTPAQIAAFAQAIDDRYAYWAGIAPEMHIPEPPHGKPTLPPPPKCLVRSGQLFKEAPLAEAPTQPEDAYLSLGGWWSPF